jgi:hypothetical protein
LDRCLETAENIFSYLNPLNWFRSTQQPQKDENIVEFDVVHTNWYWRRIHFLFTLALVLLLFVVIYFVSFRYFDKMNKASKQYDYLSSLITHPFAKDLRRKLQLGKEYLLRIHPNYGDVRAAHKYENIEKITLIDNTQLILRYIFDTKRYIHKTTHSHTCTLNILNTY